LALPPAVRCSSRIYRFCHDMLQVWSSEVLRQQFLALPLPGLLTAHCSRNNYCFCTDLVAGVVL
jgi:hypothetical protein